MDFASFAARAHAFDLHPLTPEQLRKLARLFDRGASLSDLVSRYARELGGHPAPTWRRAREVWREYLRWRDTVRAVSQRRLGEGLQLLPDEAIRRTWSAAGLRVLEEASERLPLEAFPNHAAWHDALAAVADAYHGALGVTLEQGTVHVEGDLPEGTPEAAAPLGLAPDVWLRARRAEADGGVTVRIERPEDALEEAIAGPAADVDERAEGLDAPAILRDLVGSRLEEGAREALDRRAAIEAMVDACARYRERIEAPPLRSERAGALYVGAQDQPVGVAVVARDGHFIDSEKIAAGDDGDRAASWLAERLGEGDPVVVPAEAEDDARLEQIGEALQGHEMHRVHADGLPPRKRGKRSPTVEAARILAGRAFRPRKSWSGLGAESLVLLPPGVELTGDDERRLADLLDEVAEAVRGPERPEDEKSEKKSEKGKKKPKPTGKAPAGTTRRGPEPAMNEGVRRLRDLEPGMKLRGKVTNVNRFGGFVDVGIAKEGLIPIRSLTDGFADAPTEVVRGGQRVEVRVVSVDRKRRRFELSLERVDRGGGGARGGGGRRRGGSGGKGGRRGGGRGGRRGGDRSGRGRRRGSRS
ncbi:MAG: S1 RNA-binding domain-containing protein [Myxococcota bacterium]